MVANKIACECESSVQLIASKVTFQVYMCAMEAPVLVVLARSCIRDDPSTGVYWDGRTERGPNHDQVYLGYGRSAGLFQHRTSAGTTQIPRTIW